MDAVAPITGLIDQLDDNLDNLQEVLGSLITKSLSETAATLPLLDRAKLYILATYSIESVVFCKSASQ
jgi:exosome complex protein LRP1